MAAPLRHPQRAGGDPRAPLGLPDDAQPGTRLGCRYSPDHHLHWYWSSEARRFLCRACHAWAVAQYVTFAEGKQPAGACGTPAGKTRRF